MELLIKGPEDELSPGEESSVNSFRITGFNDRVYIHSQSGAILLGWIRTVLYSEYSGMMLPFDDGNWKKPDSPPVNEKMYDVQLKTGEFLFCTVYSDKKFTLDSDLVYRSASLDEIQWIREV
jgi:hypothetical protein